MIVHRPATFRKKQQRQYIVHQCLQALRSLEATSSPTCRGHFCSLDTGAAASSGAAAPCWLTFERALRRDATLSRDAGSMGRDDRGARPQRRPLRAGARAACLLLAATSVRARPIRAYLVVT